MAKGKKHPSPLRLGMGFDEALERFIKADPQEMKGNVKKSKQKKPPGSKSKKRKLSGGISQSVISLRDRRMQKRNKGR